MTTPEISVEELKKQFREKWEGTNLQNQAISTPMMNEMFADIETILQAERQNKPTYTDIEDKNYPSKNYQTYYGAVTNSPLFQQWREEAHKHGIDVEESIETGWMSNTHFTKFLKWVLKAERQKREEVRKEIAEDLKVISKAPGVHLALLDYIQALTQPNNHK